MKLFVCSFLLSHLFAQGTEVPQYELMLSSLNQKLAKVKEDEARVEELLQEKNNITDRSRVVEIIAELNGLKTKIVQKKKEIRELDYDLRFRFPEKGDSTERVYKQFNTSSEAFTRKQEPLLKRLDRVLGQAKKTYGPTQRELDLAQKKIEELNKKGQKPKSRFQPIIVNE